MPRVVLLVTAPTVRPGLLSWPAWQELQGAAQVLAPPGGHPLLPSLDEAGITWAVLAGAAGISPAGLAGLLSAAAAGQPGTVVWLCPPAPPGTPGQAGPAGLARELARELGGAAEILEGSAGLPGGQLLVLVEVMDTLRRQCPWDARQTHESLAPFLIEESYEALDALESGDRAALCEELGDVLLQVAFHARVAAERDDGTGFTVDDVADGIVTKLVRRHPHVFADVAVTGADDVKRNWDAIKAAERAAKSGAPGSALDGVPLGQPALALAAQLQRRAERAGVPAGLADLAADGAGSGRAGTGGARSAGAGLGAELFSLVARARAAGLDPELELRAAARRYRDRVHAWEHAHPGDGQVAAGGADGA